ncbi:hypothetical protein BKG76_00145 [Mycobacteroides franklinii]|uniref:DUF3558 domain-containing protein n=1 Tax=Mycobacteroides franklinii TaxID=948102 RepID=A0A1S1LF06_9MYCO|nr:hypothetical protein [Mycobacteroides franklinii]OHU31668.1 hypothetical protein BKG76_00145 [Mycobacteroides franklinii]
MRIVRWVVWLLSAAVVAGCVQVVPGQGQAAPKPPPYLQRVDDSVRKDRARAQQLRLQDPCSLINLDAAAKLGKIKYIGTESKAEWCDIVYDVPRKTPTAQDSMADLDYVPGLVAKISVGGITTDDDAKGEQASPMEDRCFEGLRSGYQYSWGPELILFEIGISGQTRPGCEELQPVVQASRSNLSHPKLRADSLFQPHTKLVGMDSCQILDTVTGDERLNILTSSHPFNCDYQFATDKDTKRRRYLQYGYWKLQDVPVKQYEGTELKTVSGVPVEIRAEGRGGMDCMGFAYVGLDHPAHGSGPLSAQLWVDTIVIQGLEQAPGCPTIRVLAEQLVHLYQTS